MILQKRLDLVSQYGRLTQAVRSHAVHVEDEAPAPQPVDYPATPRLSASQGEREAWRTQMIDVMRKPRAIEQAGTHTVIRPFDVEGDGKVRRATLSESGDGKVTLELVSHCKWDGTTVLRFESAPVGAVSGVLGALAARVLGTTRVLQVEHGMRRKNGDFKPFGGVTVDADTGRILREWHVSRG